MSERKVATLELEKLKDAEELRRIIKERRKPVSVPPAAPPKTP